MDVQSYLLGKKAGGGSGGTTNYNELSNKPSINGVTLSGNKTTSQLDIYDKITASEIDDIVLPTLDLRTATFVTDYWKIEDAEKTLKWYEKNERAERIGTSRFDSAIIDENGQKIVGECRYNDDAFAKFYVNDVYLYNIIMDTSEGCIKLYPQS